MVGTLAPKTEEMLIGVKATDGKLIDKVDLPLTATVHDLKKEIEHSSRLEFVHE